MPTPEALRRWCLPWGRGEADAGGDSGTPERVQARLPAEREPALDAGRVDYRHHIGRPGASQRHACDEASACRMKVRQASDAGKAQGIEGGIEADALGR